MHSTIDTLMDLAFHSTNHILRLHLGKSRLELITFRSVILVDFIAKKSGKKLSSQEALDLLQNLPSEISDVLTDDFSDEKSQLIICWNFR
ncbi:hypothetical protein TNCV_1438101 [Trichonephila clavipes]|nr:hypothetical protein TNCV_1438101 [Trichonephila clavipes]